MADTATPVTLVPGDDATGVYPAILYPSAEAVAAGLGPGYAPGSLLCEDCGTEVGPTTTGFVPFVHVEVCLCRVCYGDGS